MLGNLTYEYDKNGNRIKTGGSFARTGVPQAITSTNYNVNNQQTVFGDKALTYDNNGNVQTITEGGNTTTYFWNARNQLVQISGPGANATFVYDGLGRREKKTINGAITEFLYDGLNPVQETNGAPVTANVLTGLGIDEFLVRTDTGTSASSFFLTDALGSAVALTNSSGALQTEYTYEPFGKNSFTGSTNSSSYQYTGRENDGTGLFYYRNRYYHPELARFISEDPIGFDGGDFNLYPYVGDNPLLYIDPFGLCKKHKCDPEPKPCRTMDCEPKPKEPVPPCKTPAECFPQHVGRGQGQQDPIPGNPWQDAMREWDENKRKWDEQHPGLSDLVRELEKLMRNTQSQPQPQNPSGGKGGGANSGGRLGERPKF